MSSADADRHRDGGGWLARLRARGALLDGHFRLSSGLHSPAYVQCALLLQHPDDAGAAGAALVEGLAGRVTPAPATIVSPAIGGIVLGQEVARAWGARAIWAERAGSEELTFRRGFSLAAGERVAVVEDVVTTAGSIREVMALCRSAGAEVVAAAAVVDRSAGGARWDVPWASLVEIAALQYAPESCPQCAAGVPVVKPGSRPV
jgi:orotate phosphoribosyltransferase